MKYYQKIPFNRPTVLGTEQQYISEVFMRGKFSGGGNFGTKCQELLSNHFAPSRALCTQSCTAALEMAAMLCNIRSGDEVILPSFAFSSTANAFVRNGASLKFVDVCPTTMNIDPAAIVKALSPKTKAIIALHYAGVACDMAAIKDIADPLKIPIIEDAAQSMFASFQGKPCGTLGTIGCISFHESKNLHCGEGGAIVINDPLLAERAEIILEKGTNRSQFFRGEVAKYQWLDIGSSFVLSEINASFLLAQLQQGQAITTDRLKLWKKYQELLSPLTAAGVIETAVVPEEIVNNGHIFWLKTKTQSDRDALLDYLQTRGIHSTFHYVPLHSSPAGRKYGKFVGADVVTTDSAARLLRLPIWNGFEEVSRVASAITSYFYQS